jgi:glycosyltransferase involved in cell wall biosynthesis
LRNDFHIPTTLLLAGNLADQEYYSRLCLEVARRDLGGGVEYCGVVNHSELMAFVARAHFFVSVSRWETFGIAVMEALSAGVPALAYEDVDCFWEHLDRDGACMAVPRNPFAMAEKIAKVWTDSSDYLRRSRGGREEVVKFGEGTVWKELRSIFRQWALG